MILVNSTRIEDSKTMKTIFTQPTEEKEEKSIYIINGRLVQE